MEIITMNARMDIRLDAEDKALIERAAKLSGVKTAAFTRAALIQEAEEVIRNAHIVTFDENAARECLAALSQPFTPNDALKRALDRGTELGM